MSTENKGSLLVIISGFLYGFIGYFGQSAINEHLSVYAMSFWRFMVSSVIMLAVVMMQWNRITIRGKELIAPFIVGAVFYGFSTLLYFQSSQYIGTGLGMVVFYTYPVVVMVLNYLFYRQKIPGVYYLAIAVILIGLLFLVDLSELSVDLWGLFLGLASAFFYASYLVASKGSSINPQLGALMVCMGCMVTSFFFAQGTHSLVMPSSITVWLHLLGIGVVATVIPILLMLYGLNYIASDKASILSVLEPIFVVLFGVLLLGETLKPLHILGIALILAGALLTLFSPKISLVFFKKKPSLTPGVRHSKPEP